MFKVRTVTAKPTWTPDLLARTFVGYRQSSPGARIICSALGNETPRHEGPACNRLDCKTPNPAHSKQQHFVKLPHCRASWGRKLTHPPTPDPGTPLCVLCCPQVAPTGGSHWARGCSANWHKTSCTPPPADGMVWCKTHQGLGFLLHSLQSYPDLEQIKALSVSKSSK